MSDLAKSVSIEIGRLLGGIMRSDRETIEQMVKSAIDASTAESQAENASLRADAAEALSKLGPCYHGVMEADCPSCQYHKPFMDAIGKAQCELQAAEAEVARLRAALEAISRYEGDDTHYLKQIAAAALWRGRSVSDAT